MSKIGKIEKKTNTRFLNFYELEAIHRDGRISPYYVSSRAREIDQLKAVTGRNDPDGVILYGVYGEKKDNLSFAVLCAELSREMAAIGDAHLPTWWNLL